MKYKFEQIDTEIENPEIIIDGDLGTKIIDNIQQPFFYVWIRLVTDSTSVKVKIEDEELPLDWTIESVQLWVAEQLIKYQV